MTPGVTCPCPPATTWAWLSAHFLAVGVLCGSAQAQDAETKAPAAPAASPIGTRALPEGSRGIASRYPNDSGIGADPSVVLAEDFEKHRVVADLRSTWDTVHHEAQMALVTEGADVGGGRQALQFTIPQQDREFSHAIASRLNPERDALFLRYYSKFDPPFDVVGSSHNGCTISGRYFVDGRATPGVPADGRNKFLASLEHWRGAATTPSPGELNVYIYHPEQRSQWGDHFFPSGKVLPNSSQRFDFGPAFVPRPDVVPALGRWHCYEFMVVLNSPGRRDGRLALWLDGRLHGDFQNLRLRDIEDLKLDRCGLNFHAGSNRKGPARQWVDNVVAATSYIGPVGS